MPGIIAVTLLIYAIAVSAFIIPLFLGRGSVTMMSVIIYRRFSDIFNYPGGAAMSVIVLITTLFIAYGISALLSAKAKPIT
jgi:ABC-type spermidine/putrescine transport system permease subunit I